MRHEHLPADVQKAVEAVADIVFGIGCSHAVREIDRNDALRAVNTALTELCHLAKSRGVDKRVAVNAVRSLSAHQDHWLLPRVVSTATH